MLQIFEYLSSVTDESLFNQLTCNSMTIYWPTLKIWRYGVSTAIESGNIAIIDRKAEPLERSIIAALLETPSLIDRVSEIIDGSDFVTTSAGLVYDWVLEETKSGRPVDQGVALSRFAGSGATESFIMNVLSQLPAPATLLRCAEDLRDISMRLKSARGLNTLALEFLKSEIPVQTSIGKLGSIVHSASARLSDAKTGPVAFSVVADLVRAQIATQAETGKKAGFDTDYADLNAIVSSYESGDLVIIAGRPGMGKTTFAMNLVNKVVKNGAYGIVYSLEMPKEQIVLRELSRHSRVEINKIRDSKFDIGDPEKLALGLEKIEETGIFIDDQAQLTADQIYSRTSKIVSELPEDKKLSFILIDYLQIMGMPAHMEGNRNVSPKDVITYNTGLLKRMAKDFGIPVLLLSQLNRSLEQRPNKRPINSDLRESGSIEQDADIIFFVYRDEIYHPETESKGIAEIIVGKQRNGPLGTAYLAFLGRYSAFDSLDAHSSLSLADNASEMEAARMALMSPVDGEPVGSREVSAADLVGDLRLLDFSGSNPL